MWQRWALGCLMLFWTAAPVQGSSGRIIKVLPQFLDLEGRPALTPSLFDRDAYQARLRTHPAEVSAFRFAVEWRMRGRRGAAHLRLRLEVRGQKSHQQTPITLEKAVEPGFWRRWSSLKIPRASYDELGQVTAWRATLWDGTKLLGVQRSFLW